LLRTPASLQKFGHPEGGSVNGRLRQIVVDERLEITEVIADSR